MSAFSLKRQVGVSYPMTYRLQRWLELEIKIKPVMKGAAAAKEGVDREKTPFVAIAGLNNTEPSHCNKYECYQKLSIHRKYPAGKHRY
ncbi:MAG: hypothetical protein IPN42_03550 [Methylococcaceae bacterium]|nr:hypothetical protein [Methylococcaceae bacterium]